MNKKKERFKLPEKNSRLDVRIRRSLRERLEAFCLKNDDSLTDAVTAALENYLNSQQGK
jgi:hypothetical protein